MKKIKFLYLVQTYQVDTEKVLKLHLDGVQNGDKQKGLQGKTYGIPTKDASIRRTLSIKEIKPFVDEFIEFAKSY